MGNGVKRDVFVTGVRGVLLVIGNGTTGLVWARGNGVKRVVFVAGNGDGGMVAFVTGTAVAGTDLLRGEGAHDDCLSFINCAVGMDLVVGCSDSGAALLTDDGALSFATTSAADLNGRGGPLAD